MINLCFVLPSDDLTILYLHGLHSLLEFLINHILHSTFNYFVMLFSNTRSNNVHCRSLKIQFNYENSFFTSKAGL